MSSCLPLLINVLKHVLVRIKLDNSNCTGWHGIKHWIQTTTKNIRLKWKARLPSTMAQLANFLLIQIKHAQMASEYAMWLIKLLLSMQTYVCLQAPMAICMCDKAKLTVVRDRAKIQNKKLVYLHDKFCQQYLHQRSNNKTRHALHVH